MSNDKNQGTLDPNETPVEQSEDQIKEELIEKFGLDEDVNEELIEKLVAEKVSDNKKFSTVIRQKIDWRTKAEEFTKNIDNDNVTVDGKKVPTTPPTQTVDNDAFTRMIDEKLEERDLNDTGLSDELKEKVKSYAKVEGVSVKVALESDYIKFVKQDEENNALAENASLSGKGKVGTKKDYTTNQKFEGDMSTPEGREEFKQWEAHMRTL